MAVNVRSQYRYVCPCPSKRRQGRRVGNIFLSSYSIAENIMLLTHELRWIIMLAKEDRYAVLVGARCIYCITIRWCVSVRHAVLYWSKLLEQRWGAHVQCHCHGIYPTQPTCTVILEAALLHSSSSATVPSSFASAYREDLKKPPCAKLLVVKRSVSWLTDSAVCGKHTIPRAMKSFVKRWTVF